MQSNTSEHVAPDKKRALCRNGVLRGIMIEINMGVIKRSLSCPGFGRVLQAAIYTLKCERTRDC